jgi:hypothetical protein
MLGFCFHIYLFNGQYEKSFMNDVCRLPLVSMDALPQQ